jgi:hypothetical protein
MFCDGAEMKRGFPNSLEARQSFITKYNVISLFVCFPGVTTHCGCIFTAQ